MSVYCKTFVSLQNTICVQLSVCSKQCCFTNVIKRSFDKIYWMSPKLSEETRNEHARAIP